MSVDGEKRRIDANATDLCRSVVSELSALLFRAYIDRVQFELGNEILAVDGRRRRERGLFRLELGLVHLGNRALEISCRRCDVVVVVVVSRHGGRDDFAFLNKRNRSHARTERRRQTNSIRWKCTAF